MWYSGPCLLYVKTSQQSSSGIVALCCSTLSFVLTEMLSCLLVLFVTIKENDSTVHRTPGSHFWSRHRCFWMLLWFYKSHLSPKFATVTSRAEPEVQEPLAHALRPPELRLGLSTHCKPSLHPCVLLEVVFSSKAAAIQMQIPDQRKETETLQPRGQLRQGWCSQTNVLIAG